MNKEAKIAEAIDILSQRWESEGNNVLLEWAYELEAGMTHLEIDQINRIKDFLGTVEVGDSFQRVYGRMERLGFFKLKPQIVGGDYPSLAFRSNKFLQYFRGYSFQVSGTEDGDGDYGSSNTTLSRDLRIASEMESADAWIMAFGHICQATNKYDDFWELVRTQPFLLEEFIQRTDKAYGIHCSGFSYRELMSRIERKHFLRTDTEIGRALIYSTREGSRKWIATLLIAKDFVALGKVGGDPWAVMRVPSTDETDLVVHDQIVWILSCMSGLVLSPTNSYFSKESPPSGYDPTMVSCGMHIIDNRNNYWNFMDHLSLSM